MKIGCFEVTELGPGRWKFQNLLTDVSHISYGTKEEIKEVALTQTVGWEKRFLQKHGTMGNLKFQ